MAGRGVPRPRVRGVTVAIVADKFPSDFYVTCATVIPVLFLAVAVQGRAYEWVLRTSERADRFSNKTLRIVLGLEPAAPKRPLQGTRELLADIASSALGIIALLIVIAGGAGEGLALYVLYRRSEPADARRWVFVATLVLVVAVIAGPLLALSRSLWLQLWSPWSDLVATRSDPARAVKTRISELKDGGGQPPDRPTEDNDS